MGEILALVAGAKSPYVVKGIKSRFKSAKQWPRYYGGEAFFS
jgi:hypothetical protein